MLSNTQQYIWLDHAVSPTAKYNIGGYFSFDKGINRDLFVVALHDCIHSHPIFQLAYQQNEQSLSACIEYKTELLTLSIDAAIDYFHNDFKKPFGPLASLYQSILVVTPNGSLLWYIKMHHLIADGWCFSLLIQQISERYAALINEQPWTICFPSYQEFVVKEASYFESSRCQSDKDFWFEQFKTLPKPLFSHAHLGHEINSATLIHDVNTHVTQRLAYIAQTTQMTLAQWFETSLVIVLSKFYRSTDICLGMPISNRSSYFKNTIGPFINLVPLRIQFSEDDSVSELIAHIKYQHTKCLKHRQFQHANIVDLLPNTVPGMRLYDVRFSFEPFDYPNVMCGQSYAIYPLANHAETEPLSIHVRLYNVTHIQIEFNYNQLIISNAEANALMDTWIDFLSNHDVLPHKTIGQLTIGTQQQHQQVLQFAQGKQTVLSIKPTLHMQWLSVLARYWTNIAIVEHSKIYTYAQVEQAISLVAAALLAKGIKTYDNIAVMLPRSAAFIISVFAINRIGAVFVPIDERLPTERVLSILEQISCAALIGTSVAPRDDLPIEYTNKILCFDELLQYPDTQSTSLSLSHDAACYILFTSGSTGKPKGVIVSQSALMNYIDYFIIYFSIKTSDRVFHQASIGFDTAFEEIFPALLSGATLIIAQDNCDFPGMYAQLQMQQVTLLSSHPHFIRFVNQQPSLSSLYLRTVISGGELLHSRDINFLFDYSTIYNTFGPTEATICCCYYPIHSLNAPILIGSPIQNTSLYVLSEVNQLLPPFAIGELVIAGMGLAQGYIGNNSVKSTFIDVAFDEHQRMYRTGDLVRWLDSGCLEFIGRKDDQIKIRGQRLELTEIASLLEQREDVIAATVLVSGEADDPYLVVYCIVADQTIDRYSLYSYLLVKLPQYMVPRYYVYLSEFPLNERGKLDKSAFPIPKTSDGIRLSHAVPPETAHQKQLFAIWQSVLGHAKFGIFENFFEVGGHSLLLFTLKQAILKAYHVDVPLAQLFTHTTIATQDTLIAALSSVLKQGNIQALPLMPRQDYPLTSAQQRIWLLSHKKQEVNAYHILGSYQLVGPISLTVLTSCFNQLMARHDNLRTVFYLTAQGDLRQKVVSMQDMQPFMMDVVVGTSLTRNAVMSNFIQKPFCLEKGPLWRAQIVQDDGDTAYLTLAIHHIICDGWSIDILFRELLDLYDNKALPPLEYSFQHYVHAKERYMQSPQFSIDQQFWENMYASTCEPLDVRLKGFNNTQPQSLGAMHCIHYSAQQIQVLQQYLASQHVTLYTGLLASLRILFTRYTQQFDTVLGAIVADREDSAWRDQVGLFLNTLALRGTISYDDTFSTVCQSEQHVLQQALVHQSYPFDHITAYVTARHKIPSDKFVNILVVLHTQHDPNYSKLTLPNVVITPYRPLCEQQSQFELQFAFFREKNNSLRLELRYQQECFDAETVSLLCQHHQRLLDAIIADPNATIGTLDYLTTTEIQRLSYLALGEQIVVNQSSCLPTIHENMERWANDIAFYHGDKSYNYGWLQTESDAFASFLLDRYSLKRSQIIAVQLERDPWLIVTLLAIMKLGCAYLPIDMQYPAARRDYILRQSECELIITQQVLGAFFQVAANQSSLQSIPIAPLDLAYIIYTSGSTGDPKGIAITHGNLLQFLLWCQREFSNSKYDIVYAATSHSFDLSIFELFFSLFARKPFRLLDSPLLIVEYLDYDHNILVNTVPSVIHTLIEQKKDLSNISVLNMAGEALSPSIVHALDCIHCEVRNLYGPSEDTTYSTVYRVQGHETIVPIGRPIQNTQLYLLDANLQHMPMGRIGEVCLAGSHLAQGYLHQPVLTQQLFISNPYPDHQRLYRTGDLAYYNPKGDVVYVGRKDSQVKVNGFRIECADVEAALNRLQLWIEQAVVLARLDRHGENHLVAFVVLRESCLISEIRQALAQKLPPYMLPRDILPLPKLPITANGKIDRRVLLEYSEPVHESHKDMSRIVADDKTAHIIELWKISLGHSHFDENSNFFHVGGSSLKLVSIFSNLQKVYGDSITLQHILNNETIRDLADTIREMVPIAASLPEEDSILLTTQLSSTEYGIWLACHQEGLNRAHNIICVFDLEGKIVASLFKKSVSHVIAQQPNLRVRYLCEGTTVQKTLTPFAVFAQQDCVRYVPLSDVHETSITACIDAEFERIFDLMHGPLFSVHLFQTSATNAVLVINMHHIIADATAINFFVNAVLEQYVQYSQGEQTVCSLDTLVEPVTDDAKALNYAINKRVTLPYDHMVRNNRTYKAQVKCFDLDDYGAKVYRLAQQHHTTVFVLLTALFSIQLHHLNNQTSFVLAIPVSARQPNSLGIGCYLNILPLNIDIQRTDSFLDFVVRIKQQIREIQLQKNTVLFSQNVMVDMLHDQFFTLTENTDIRISLRHITARYTKAELILYIKETDTGIELMYEYDCECFDRDTIDVLVDQMIHAVAALVEDETKNIASLFTYEFDIAGLI